MIYAKQPAPADNFYINRIVENFMQFDSGCKIFTDGNPSAKKEELHNKVPLQIDLTANVLIRTVIWRGIEPCAR